MKTTISLGIVFAFFLLQLQGQIGRLDLSPLQKVEQHIGSTDITLEYSRPSKRGREIFGQLVPYHTLWRTGANRNTSIQFSREVVINQQRVAEGEYAIFSKPAPNQWEVIFYQDTDNWDVPESLDSGKIVARIIVPTIRMNQDREVLSISIGDFTNYEFDLSIHWSDVSVSVPIELTTKEMMDARIQDVLSGPSYHDYYDAAVYQMESGKEFAQGVQWINQAIEVTDKVTWWDLRVKAILLAGMGKDDEALRIAKEGLIMAEEEGREYGIREFQQLIKQLE